MINRPRLARPTTKQRIVLLASPLVVGLIVPSLTKALVQCFVGGIPLGAAVADVLQKQFASGHNLFLLSLFGLIPFVVLVVQLLDDTKNRTFRACVVICACGLVGILALVIPTHFMVWYPLYGPGRMGSTDAVAFVFIPIYSIVPLFMALGIGRLVTRFPWFQPYPKGHCQRCGYNLQGNVSGVCPECGTKASP